MYLNFVKCNRSRMICLIPHIQWKITTNVSVQNAWGEVFSVDKIRFFFLKKCHFRRYFITKKSLSYTKKCVFNKRHKRLMVIIQALMNSVNKFKDWLCNTCNVEWMKINTKSGVKEVFWCEIQFKFEFIQWLMNIQVEKWHFKVQS